MNRKFIRCTILANSRKGKCQEEYRGFDIYTSPSGYGVHIYTELFGRGKVEFVDADEAHEYIDNLIDHPLTDEAQIYEVRYVNSLDKVAYAEVEAKSVEQAEQKVRSRLRNEIYSILDIYQVD